MKPRLLGTSGLPPSLIPKKIAPDQIPVRRGDFLMSAWAAPDIDYIVTTGGHPNVARFFPDRLRRYLNLLELVVLNERVILGCCNVFSGLDASIRDSYAYGFAFRQARIIVDHLHIHDEAYQSLYEKGILLEGELEDPELTPGGLLTSHLPLLRKAREEMAAFRRLLKPYEQDEAVLDAIVQAEANNAIGVPLYIREFARRNHLPFLLSDQQAAALTKLENLELRVRFDAIAFLKDRLDSGARQELERLSDLGVETIFPETPIAWQIVRDSSRPEDLLNVAFQLRTNYAHFRADMVELESELLKEDISLARKLRILQHLEESAAELWPSDRPGLRKVTTELSELLGILPSSGAPIPIATATDITKYLLSRPVDYILRYIRRRRVRVLLKAKRDFMRSKSWSSKLAGVFGVPTAVIIDALNDAPQGPRR